MAKKTIKIENDLVDELIKTKKSKLTVDKSANNIKIPEPRECVPQTNIKFKLKPGAELPQYAHDGDAGMDVKAIDVEYDRETDTYIYHTGVAYESGYGVVSFGLARSSNSKTDCYLTNGVGTIDCATYRGDIQFRFKDRTSIETRTTKSALIHMATVPWWKRVFMTSDDLMVEYNKAWAEAYEFHIRHALDYAPYHVGDRIGQITFIQFLKANTEVVDKLSETERGEGGFGSTNLKHPEFSTSIDGDYCKKV